MRVGTFGTPKGQQVNRPRDLSNPQGANRQKTPRQRRRGRKQEIVDEIELPEITYTVALLEDSTAAPLVAGNDYVVVIDHSNVGTFDYIENTRVVPDCGLTKVAITEGLVSTGSVLYLYVSLASDIDAGSYGTAVQLQLDITQQGFGLTTGPGGSATATAYTFAGLFADFVNVTGDTMTGQLKLAPSTDITELLIQMIASQTASPFKITDEDGTAVFEFDDDGSITVRPHSTGSPAFNGWGAGSSASTVHFSYRGRASRGTRDSPAAVQSGDRLVELTGGGQYDTTEGHTHNVQVSIRARAAEAYSSTNAGSEIEVHTTPIGGTTLTRAAKFKENGDFLSDQKVLATAGLGVGNSAAGSTLGTVTKKMEVFDASGVSLGFVPIYDAIT